MATPARVESVLSARNLALRNATARLRTALSAMTVNALGVWLGTPSQYWEAAYAAQATGQADELLRRGLLDATQTIRDYSGREDVSGVQSLMTTGEGLREAAAVQLARIRRYSPGSGWNAATMQSAMSRAASQVSESAAKTTAEVVHSVATPYDDPSAGKEALIEEQEAGGASTGVVLALLAGAGVLGYLIWKDRKG